MKAKISKGNTKLGTISNISITPITTCMIVVAGKKKVPPCAKYCYSLKSQRMYKGTRAMRSHNLRAYRRTPKQYFESIIDKTKNVKLFRWHVAGDIVDRSYLLGMIYVANENPKTSYLVFTKQYKICNSVFSSIQRPTNLTIVFSAWPGFKMNNKHNFPIAFMSPRNGVENRINGTEIKCPGNCKSCNICWNLPALKRNVVFQQH